LHKFLNYYTMIYKMPYNPDALQVMQIILGLVASLKVVMT